MTPFHHLNDFISCMENKKKANPSHLSIFLALYYYWWLNGCKNPVRISRGEIMKTSRIFSTATYHKCMKELHFWKIIDYKPSFNPYKGSEVKINKLD